MKLQTPWRNEQSRLLSGTIVAVAVWCAPPVSGQTACDANTRLSAETIAATPTTAATQTTAAAQKTAAAQTTGTAETPVIAGASDVVSRVFRLSPVDVNVKQVVVTAMAVDPRGEFLAVAGDDHVIRILNADSLTEIRTLGDGGRRNRGGSDGTGTGHFDWIRTLAFDAAGDRLASAGNDGQLILWDRRRDFAVMQEIESAPALASVRFSPSGDQIAAVGFDRQVFLIGKTAGETPPLRGDCVDLRCCVYRADGKMLAVAGRNGHLHLFDPVLGKTIAELKLHTARIRDMAFQPGTAILASVSEDGEIVRLDTTQNEVLSRKRITSGRLFTLAWIDAKRIAAAGSDDEIHLIGVREDGRGLKRDGTLSGHVGSISTLVVHNGSLISGGFDATLRRWDLPLPGIAASKIARGVEAAVPVETIGPTPR